MEVLIADDDNYYSSFIKHILQLTGVDNIICCNSFDSLMKSITELTDAVYLDYYLADKSGHDVFKSIKNKYPELEVVIISGQQDVDIAVDLLRIGAFDYIVKNETTKNRIVQSVSKLKKQADLKKRLVDLEVALSDKYNFRKVLLSNDRSFEKIYTLINKAALSNINVSIYGKTGTGKELVAKSIHYNSKRKGKPFVAVNLSAISETLLESELFGYEKGAFTGAQQRRIGRFEEANGGTLFLDEISEVSLSIQVKLLRVIQERQIVRLGSNKPIPIDCRIICASNKVLIDEVGQGNFREDFFYRIIGLPIELPDLKERGNDSIFLANHFAVVFTKKNNLPSVSFTDSAIEKLKAYSFPGNVRELKSMVELACVLCEDNLITEQNLVLNRIVPDEQILDQGLTLKEMNKKIITTMLQKHNDNVRVVARKLDIGKSTIYRLLKEED